jgi:hypothetical protein
MAALAVPHVFGHAELQLRLAPRQALTLRTSALVSAGHVASFMTCCCFWHNPDIGEAGDDQLHHKRSQQ